MPERAHLTLEFRAPEPGALERLGAALRDLTRDEARARRLDVQIEEGIAFGPKEARWTYGNGEGERFSSNFISGAQRLPNGNTLICSGADGRLLEVTAENEIVWEYVNGFFDEGITPAGRRGPNRGPRGRRGGPPDGGPPGRGRPPGRGGPPDGDPRDGGQRGRRGGGGGGPNIIFRALRFAPDHPGLARLDEDAPTQEDDTE